MGTETDELEQLQESEAQLRKPTREIVQEWDKPLTFTARDSYGQPLSREAYNLHDLSYHTVNTGIFWITGPMPGPFGAYAQKLQAKLDRKAGRSVTVSPKCVCPTCGKAHTPR